MLWTEYRPVIKIGPKGALGSHEIRAIHSAPSLGHSIVKRICDIVHCDLLVSSARRCFTTSLSLLCDLKNYKNSVTLITQ